MCYRRKSSESSTSTLGNMKFRHFRSQPVDCFQDATTCNIEDESVILYDSERLYKCGGYHDVIVDTKKLVMCTTVSFLHSFTCKFAKNGEIDWAHVAKSTGKSGFYVTGDVNKKHRIESEYTWLTHFQPAVGCVMLWRPRDSIMMFSEWHSI